MCLKMDDLMHRMLEMPAVDNGASLSTSPAVLSLLSSRRHIHIYGARITIDELLHLGSLIHSYYHRPPNGVSRGPGAVIVVDDVADAFSKVTALAAHVTNERPANTSNAIYCFSRIAIVRGPKPPNFCTNAAAYNNSLGAAASALRKTLEHFAQLFSTNRAIWHSHQDPSLLLHMINTSPNGSPPIDAVSVFSALLFTGASTSNGTKTPGAITLADPRSGYGLSNVWSLLITATTRAHNGRGIPIVFYSNCSMRVYLQAYSTQHLAGIPDLFPVMLPEAVWKPVFGQVMDQLLVAAFRLLAGGDLTAASPKRVGKTVVDEVKRRLNAQVAKGWAKLCIDPRSYGEAEIMRTVRGALPNGGAPNTPLFTLEALKTTIRKPTPMSPATALSRPAIGPHSASSPSLWAIRASIAPRSAPLPANTPASSMALTIARSGTTHILCTPPSATRTSSSATSNGLLLATSNTTIPTSGDDHRHPRAVQQDVGTRWAGYVSAVRHRTTSTNSSGFKATGNGFGVSVQTARVWMAVVPGVFAAAVEQWGRAVVGRMPAGEQAAAARRLEEEVKAVLKEAREGKVTEMCRGVLGG
ncbi:uncharacterized protein LTHEOB_12813 [Lasiodiplodia theobromae]|uniref:uncharacterized protein n=1 Tax=Lasiodiplodia theobromae TaxID=45133 RepID=UPI0015C327E8|nr:uncharacterized protein LTHEOB_12813 [Lasiodiplodia theobromae]KAF4535124.1 hypothetical protein LTHEOB_12813 [Lasiodiplodia theobromae]